ncbi:MAG: ion transporter [Paludibacterium sp.]|uniref:ion transporter n=1 Tax=Paludibacterium sp. TaxID=1917523 RepID=UPI0025EA7827|nr:ion transporter [Paludibacterium sp.]MBV8049175.1 ion transporter [Paludibacterium sp.]MBV8646204.1 ion transporter [Paludibacterium sp.]
MSLPDLARALRRTLRTLLFAPDTWRGRLFDQVLIAAILLAVLTVTLESVPSIRAEHAPLLHAVDWGLTLLFTVEYLLRLFCARKPLHYARSFFGIIDLLAILPQYIALFLPQSRFLSVVRILRLLSMFRVFKLTRYLGVAQSLRDALRASQRKITVFLVAALVMVMVLGTLMYVIEGEENGFTSIPVSIYWAIVTLTTVGYGDIAPQTPLGQALASLVMIIGYGMIAVPTGIVSSEIARRDGVQAIEAVCRPCALGEHDRDARYCKYCGRPLVDQTQWQITGSEGP